MCDSAEPGTAVPTLQLENDRVRVTEWRFPKKGDNTGWHRHAYDYIVVPQFDGILEIDLGNGERTTATLQKGVPYYRDRCQTTPPAP